jgi:hypothetical protein
MGPAVHYPGMAPTIKQFPKGVKWCVEGQTSISEKLRRNSKPISTVSQGAVNEVVIRLNSTHRKVPGYQTPLEVFTAYIIKVFELTLEFRRRLVSKTTFFETDPATW